MTDTTLLKSTTLELSINPNYVRSWGVWEAVRELVQNGLDSHDQGFDLRIERGSGASKTIYIRNDGTSLARSTLLLGSTSKADGGARGKFGEGYKLAFLVLCRNGIDVQVRTGAEMWTPFIEKSDTFGSEVLKVKIRPASKFEDKVEVQIHGVSDTDWDTIQGRMIDIPGLKRTQLKEGEFIQVGQNKVLTAERFQSTLYSRGLFVSRLPDNYTYGYDLAAVQLDRDRKAPDTWSLRTEITQVMGRAMETGGLTTEEVFKMCSTECGEADVVGQYYAYGYSDQLTKSLTNEFERVYGENAAPVASMSESMDAGHYGLKGQIVSKALRNVIEKERGTFEDRKASKAFDVSSFFSFQDLTLEERDNLAWASRLVTLAEPRYSLKLLQVVDFFGDHIDGTWSAEDGVRLSRKVVSDRKKLVATLVHEVGHMDGAADGSVEHRDAIDRIFSSIVVALSTN